MADNLVLLKDRNRLLWVELGTEEWIFLTLNRGYNRAAVWHVGDCCQIEHASEALVSFELVRVHAPVVRVVCHIMVVEEVCLIAQPLIELG